LYEGSDINNNYNSNVTLLVIFGGEWVHTFTLSDLWTLDISTGAWSFIGNETTSSYWPSPMAHHSAVVWNNTMIIFGGCFHIVSSPLTTSPQCGAVNPALWFYDFQTQSWSNITGTSGNSSSWPEARWGHVGVLVDNGTMLIYGGMSAKNTVLNDAWIFDLAELSWHSVSPVGMPTSGRYNQAALVLSDPSTVDSSSSSVLMFGGASNCDPTAEISAFFEWNNFTEAEGGGIWITLVSPMLSEGTPALVTASRDNQELFYVSTMVGTFASYIINNGNYSLSYWRTRAKVPISNPLSGFVTWNVTHLAAFSGHNNITIYFYDISGNSWTTMVLDTLAPEFFTTALLSDNNVLLLKPSELMLISLNNSSFAIELTTKSPPILTTNGSTTAVLVNDGFYVFGLASSSFLLYNVTEDTWSQLTLSSEDALAPIGFQDITGVSMGVKVLLYGGEAQDDTFSGDLWEYDTVVHNWTRIETQSAPRSRAQAAGVAINSTLFIYGGFDGYAFQNDLWSLDLGCNPGSSCHEAFFSSSSCLLCDYGSYSSDFGSSQCTLCPYGLNTTNNGSKLVTDCNRCVENYCHNGDCTAETARGVTCACHFGFLPFDRCYFPWIWLAVTACVVLLAFAARHYQRRMALQKEVIKEQMQEISQLYEVWKIDASEITWESCVSRGGFGEVWRCEWRETVVAVKKLHEHWVCYSNSIGCCLLLILTLLRQLELEDSTTEEFENEIKLLRSIRHPRIVLFYGAGKLDDGTPFLVCRII